MPDPTGVIVPEDRIALYNSDSVKDIQKTAEIILTAIADIAAYCEIELPSRQIVYVGTVPRDMEQVAVTVSTAGFGRPGDPMQGPGINNDCWLPKRATFNAEITRCVPESNQVRAPGRYASGAVNLPSQASMEDHAATVMADMMVLLEAAQVASNYPFEGSGAEANVMVLDPESGYQSVVLSITALV